MNARPAAALLVVVAVAVAGCGGTSTKTESAATFMKRITVEFSRGQAGRLWDELVPAEQAVVPRATYVACGRNGFRLRAFKVLDQYDEPVAVLARQLPAKAVSVQVTSDDGVTTATMHAVKVDGRWRWVLSRADLAAFRAGRCP
ncbi:MAG: hypothetical protein ACXVRJ_00090 [Gaiellaceae bacterium]